MKGPQGLVDMAGTKKRGCLRVSAPGGRLLTAEFHCASRGDLFEDIVGATLRPVTLAVQVSFTDKPGPPAANGSSASEAFAEETLNEPAAQEP